MPTVDDFLERDRLAIAEVTGRLRDFSPDLPSALNDVLAVFERISEALSRGATDDDDLRIINECGEKLGAETRADLQGLLDGPQPADPARAEPISEIRLAASRVSSRRVRAILLGLVWRSFIRSATDLLRLRASSAIGYLRPQIEAAALAAIARERPEVAASWQRTGLDVEGKHFYREQQPGILRFADRHGLRADYERASERAMHVRLASVAGGFEQSLFERGERAVHEIQVLYVEDSPNEPWILILEALNILRAQCRLLAGIRDGFPEVPEEAVAASGLPELRRKVHTLFAHIRDVFPDKVRQWERSSAEER